MEKVTGRPVKPHKQQFGDCVGHSYALGVDILNCVQIELNKQYKWEAAVSPEYIYAGSREVGDNLDGPEGSNGVYASEFVKKNGVLVRKNYLGLYDLRKYDPDLSKKWGKKGVPLALKPLSKLHPVKSVAQVTSYEQARDSVINGYPIAICSSQGFCKKCGRDKEGFIHPVGRWYHSMLLAGIDDKSDRKGGLLLNSWGGHWVKGPLPNNEPAGSFWIERDVLDGMLRWGDSYSLSNYKGYRRQKLDFDLI